MVGGKGTYFLPIKKAKAEKKENRLLHYSFFQSVKERYIVSGGSADSLRTISVPLDRHHFHSVG